MLSCQVLFLLASSAVLPTSRSLGAFDAKAIGNFQRVQDFSLVPLKINRDNNYVADISVGTPPQKLKCLIDTGSSDLWVPSRRCENCGAERHFDAYASSTFMAKTVATAEGLAPVSVRLDYGSGAIVGYYVMDTVEFGTVSFPNQTFLIVEDADLPQRRSWDGICGLGWRRLAVSAKPLYENLQDLGHRAIFTLVPVTQSAGDAYIVVGELPESSYKPDTLVWAPAEMLGSTTERSFWITSGGLAVKQAEPSPVKFLVDTGTNFFLVPPRYFMKLIHSLFPPKVFNRLCGFDENAGAVICECRVRSAEGMLPLRLYLGGRAFSVEVEKLFTEVETTDGDRVCLLQVQQNPLALAEGPEDLLDSILGPFGGLPGLGLGADVRGGGGGGDGPFPRFPFPLPGGFPGGQDSGFPFSLLPPRGDAGEDSGDQWPGSPFGFPAGGHGEVVEESMGSRSDGSFCRTTLRWKDGRIVENTTVCHAANARPDERRLQFRQVMGMDDLFILGSPFLQSFITIFDFEEGRLGFAEPAGSSASLPTVGLIGELQQGRTGSRSTLRTGRTPWALLPLAAGAASLAMMASAFSLLAARRSRPLIGTDVEFLGPME